MNFGFLLINKPEGPTSFDIIRDLRRQLQIKKMGHAGTLDPLASGLLIIAVGQATKLLSLIPVDDKVYEFTLQFGEERDTGDRVGRVIAESDVVPTAEQIKAILPQFTGTITQVPPAYSAIKIKGQRAYDLARKGIDVEMPSREVFIRALDFIALDTDTKSAIFRVHCSSGTYVRSLTRDIAKVLGSEGYAACIHRTAIGPFLLENAQNIADVTVPEMITPPHKTLADWPQVELTDKEYGLVYNGNRVPTGEAESPAVWALYKGEDVAACKIEEGLLIPKRVFH